MPRLTPFARTFALVVLVSSVAACGDDDDVTGVNISANVRTVIDDNPSRETPPAPAKNQAPPTSGPFSGTFAGTARVQLSADGANWVDVGGPSGIDFTVQTGDSAVVGGNVTIPAATYNRARLILRGSQLRLHGNVAGVILTDALVNVADTEVTIERQITPIAITAATNARLAFDLNSEKWVTAETATSRVVQGSKLAAAVQASAATGVAAN